MEAYRYLNKTFFIDGIEEVKLYQVYDGDTASFVAKDGTRITTRFLGINAPEYTKKLEPFGKEALDFTRSRLENAKSIIIEADGDKAELDNTHNRYLAYVWYKIDNEYILLNEEIIASSLAKPLLMNNVTKYFYEISDAFNRVKGKGLGINGALDESFNSIYKDITVSELIKNKDLYEGKTIRVSGIVTRKLSKSFFVSDGDTGMYVYNTYYDISKFEIGDRIKFVAQFSLDNVYGEQLTNIRGVEIIESKSPYRIIDIIDLEDGISYVGKIVRLKSFYCIGVENIHKRTSTYYVDGILGKSNIKIKVSGSLTTAVKKTFFKKGKMLDIVVGVINYRKSFSEELSQIFVLCNDFEKDLVEIE